jgi:hypothetical protein
MYHLVVALALVAHFAFLCYLIVGGFAALRWRRTIGLHVPAVLWGTAITTAHLDCPLTWLERWSRAKAGLVPVAVFALVALSWALYVRTCVRDRPINANDEL